MDNRRERGKGTRATDWVIDAGVIAAVCASCDDILAAQLSFLDWGGKGEGGQGGGEDGNDGLHGW